MLGMHGTYEANMAMNQCDLMLCVGARFDDRVTGRLDAFSAGIRRRSTSISIRPRSTRTSPSTCRSSATWRRCWSDDRGGRNATTSRQAALKQWWGQIGEWRARNCLAYRQDTAVEIKPQHALSGCMRRPSRDTFITTEVGQHQMWAAQFIKFEKPNRWMTSGGLGTMGYGLPAAIGVQLGHPGKLVIDVAGEASILMNIQELSTAVQHRLPVKVFILNNQYMGMVRQWQELLHGGRYSESYSEALPDFVKLAESLRLDGPAGDQARGSRRRHRRR
jgi:acetolactate synthase-1/2/3 large subunit